MAVHQITYGSFSFDVAVMTTTQEVLWGPDGITQMGVKYNFTIKGWITGKTEAEFATKLIQAECQLTRARQTFSVGWAQTASGPFSISYKFDPADDNDWGPKPGRLDIQRFSGGRAAYFSWSLEVTSKKCYTGDCSSQSGNVNGILSIARKWDFEIDPNGFTCRTVSGVLIVTSASVQAGRPAESFRGTVTPGLPSFYKREHQRFSQSENGRVLTFSIVDQEQMWTLPTFISNGSARFGIRSSDFGATIYYTLSGRFEAPANVSKDTIRERITALCASKLPQTGGGVTVYPISQDLTEDVYRNAIDFSVHCRSAGGFGPGQSDPFSFQRGIPFGFAPPDGDSGKSQWIGPFGGDGNITSGVSAAAPPIYDACDGNTSPGNSSRPPSTTSTSDPGSPPSTQQSVTTSNPTISAEHAANMWLDYEELYSYEIDTGIVPVYPKIEGKDPKMLKVRPASMRVVQAGFSRQVVKSPADLAPAPSPSLGKSGTVLHSSVVLSNGDQMGASAYYVYLTRWCYTIVFNKHLSSGFADFFFPNDPRYSPKTGGAMTDAPKLIP